MLSLRDRYPIVARIFPPLLVFLLMVTALPALGGE